jgi:hypothetical protein
VLVAVDSRRVWRPGGVIDLADSANLLAFFRFVEGQPLLYTGFDKDGVAVGLALTERLKFESDGAVVLTTSSSFQFFKGRDGTPIHSYELRHGGSSISIDLREGLIIQPGKQMRTRYTIHMVAVLAEGAGPWH